MTGYLIDFNQRRVGDHPAEWFRGRGPLGLAWLPSLRGARRQQFGSFAAGTCPRWVDRLRSSSP